MSAEAARTRSALFFVEYLALLAAAAAWVQFPVVRQRVGGHLPLFYLLLAVSACYVLVRAYVVLVRRVDLRLRNLWMALDLGVITGAVSLTGGMDSEAGLLYFWPIVTSAIQRQPQRTIAISVASGVLYFLTTWPDHGDPTYPGAMMARFVVLIIVSSLAASFAHAETTHIEEVTKLREQVALAEYRGRLSQEMHDGIQGYLGGIAVRLELARKAMIDDPAAAARLAVDQRFAIRQAIAELRYLVHLLRSPAVEQGGFVEALQHHVSVFAEGSPTSVLLETEGEARPLPPEVAHAAFRIAQEALVNVEKHARATEVRVRLCFAENSLTCSIRDNGVGFDPAAAPKASRLAGGFGLPSMAQRAESVGGELHLTSAPGQGTEVTFTAPVGAEGERPQKGR